MKQCTKLLFAMLVAFASTISSFAYDFEVDGIYYNITSSESSYTCAVTFKDKNFYYYGDVVIPSSVNYNGCNYSVTWIDDYAFSGCSGLTSITIPNSVTWIGDHAFSGCSGLASINIPNSVTWIGNDAFASCSGLTSINIPNSVTEIGNNAFEHCSGLTSINIPDGVTEIGVSTFSYCSGLASINIPNSVTTIGSEAFSNCSGLTSINIPNSVTLIGGGAFSGCSGLISINIPNSVTWIGNNVFQNCSSLTSITIPDGVTEIGSRAFSGCRGLTSINIPDGVTEIGEGAFYNCSGLTSINIPNSVTTIGEFVLYGCIGLTSINIPNSVTEIGNYVLSGCSGLTSINIPNSVTWIGEHAFSGCSSLTSINIPNSVTWIGSYAFEYCSGLKSITIPNSVTEISNHAFIYCSSLASVTCYAENPPQIFGETFIEISPDAKLFVLNIYLYLDSDWSKSFKEILPISSRLIQSLKVNLPEDWSDGKYSNMVIELVEKAGEQKYKIVVSDKASYKFSGVKPSTYKLTMKNQWGDVLGEIDEIEVKDEDVKVSFENLRHPKTVTLNVLANYGEDVTEKVAVNWMKTDGELMKQGVSINGVLVGSEIAYSLVLPDEMLSKYVSPAKQTYIVAEDGNNIHCTLEALGLIKLEGTIVDANGKAQPYAVLTISQLINGKYGNTVTVTTDAAGHYAVEVPNLPVKITVSANGYLSQTVELQNTAEGLGDVALEKISGLTISAMTDLADNANVAYKVLDAKGNELSGCIYQGSMIVLPSSAAIGDELTVVAYSKNNRFKDAQKQIVLDDKNTYIEMNIVEYGGLEVKCEGDGYGCVAILYNNVGDLTEKASFSEGAATFVNVPDGEYSVVAMKKSTEFNSILNLTALSGAGLTKGTDYLLASATVESGNVSAVSLGKIPELDEAKLYLTSKENTYFMTGKPELTIGRHQILKARVDLKEEYRNKAEDAVLVVDIPSNCEFVEQSVMSGESYVYQKDGNRIIIPMESLGDIVRFCIIPWEPGEIRPNAFVRLKIDNDEKLLPIGSAYFEAKGLSLSCIEKTGKATIGLRGSATPNSEVLIYDNETLVGKTNALANGDWTANITFAKPYSRSMHDIYGEVLTSDGKRLLTETKLVKYDKNFVDAGKVTMLYCNDWGHKIYVVEFDPISGTTSRGYYNYYPSCTNFTFTADFSNTDPSLISKLTFIVLASDGTTRSLEGKYNEATGVWVASSKYADTQKLPVNVKVEYEMAEASSMYVAEMENDYNESLENAISSILPLYENGDIEVVLSNEREVIISVIPEGESDKEYFKFEKLNYSEIKKELNDSTGTIKNDTIDISFKFAVEKGGILLICLDNLSKESFKFTYSVTNPITQNIKQKRIVPLVLGLVYGAGISVFERNLDQGLIDFWSKSYIYDLKMCNENINKLKKMLRAKCKDGTNQIKDNQLLVSCNKSVNDWQIQAINFFESYKKYIKLLESFFDAKLGLNFAVNSVMTFIGARVGPLIKSVVPAASYKILPQIASLKLDALTTILGGASGKYIVDSIFFKKCAFPEAVSNWHFNESKKLTESYVGVIKKIKGSYSKCDDDDDDDDDGDDDDFPTPPVTPAIDPSGYVYEAVPSNRLQGVTATVYYLKQTEDMYGDVTEEPVVWEAAEFGQRNPLTTDEQGMYQWDVPQGMWQVKFEKEGYETTYSEWLPVPPPQLDVNIAMVQAKQPEVNSLHAYTDGVTIEFDKFMMPETLETENIRVTQNGREFDGTVKLINPEADGKGNTYCSKIEFVPFTELAEGEATVFVSQKVKSYAGLQMNDDFEKTVKVEAKVKDISVEDVKVFSGYTAKIEASILPVSAGAGKKFVVESMNPYIAAVDKGSIAMDGKGNVSFEVKGLIPGRAVVRIALEGYDFYKDVVVTVMEMDKVAEPVASVASGSVVVKGTEVYLTCATDGATIYYTTDGSCPCDMETAIVYDGTPVVINESVTIKAIAMKQDMEDSRIAEFAYIVNDDTAVEMVEGKKVLCIYPLPMRDRISISVGGRTITRVSVCTMDGSVVRSVDEAGAEVQLNVQSLPSGIYIVNVSTDDGTLHRKVVKVD